MNLCKALLILLLIIAVASGAETMGWFDRCEATFVDGSKVQGIRAVPYGLMMLPLGLCVLAPGVIVGGIVFTKAKLTGKDEVMLWGNTYHVTWEGESDGS